MDVMRKLMAAQASAAAPADAAPAPAPAPAQRVLQPVIPPTLSVPTPDPTPVKKPAAAPKKPAPKPAPKKPAASRKRSKEEISSDEEESEEEEESEAESSELEEEDDEEDDEEDNTADDEDEEAEEEVEDEGKVASKKAVKKTTKAKDTVTTTGRRARSEKGSKKAKSSVFRGAPTSSSGTVARLAIANCLKDHPELEQYVRVTPDVIAEERRHMLGAFSAASVATVNGMVSKVHNHGTDPKRERHALQVQSIFKVLHSTFQTGVPTEHLSEPQAFCDAVKTLVAYARQHDSQDFFVLINNYLVPLSTVVSTDDIFQWADVRAAYAIHPDNLRAVANALALIKMGALEADWAKDLAAINQGKAMVIMHLAVIIVQWYVSERMALAKTLFTEANKGEMSRLDRDSLSVSVSALFCKLDASFADKHGFDVYNSEQVQKRMKERAAVAKERAAKSGKELPVVVNQLDKNAVVNFCLRSKSNSALLPRMLQLLCMLPFSVLKAMHVKEADSSAWMRTTELVVTEMKRLAENKKLDALQQVFLCLSSQATVNAFLAQFVRMSIDANKTTKSTTAAKSAKEPKAKKAKTTV